MPMPSGAPIPVVVQQHVEESAILRGNRSVLVRAPHVKLYHLRRLDDRIAAHLDGVAVAGEFGWSMTEAALENPGAGELFTALVRAIEDRNGFGISKLLALAEALPESRRGVLSAFGWVSAQSLRGITKGLLDAPDAFPRQVGIAACGMHHVDPARALDAAIVDADPTLRERALRVAGVLGRVDRLPACQRAMTDADDGCRFHSAWAALLLGDREGSIRSLELLASAPGRHRWSALRLLLMTVAPERAHALLKSIAQDPANVRRVVQGAGVAGDPRYVPWLIKQMDDLKLTRLAGEAFSLITGVDLAHLDLERKPPEDVEFGPTDDPGDDDVSMDEDDSLPWPDAMKVSAWWEVNGSRFLAGTRYFMGEVPSHGHCRQILKDGYQRQRIAAAQYLCLLRPGTPLFGTAAPAWRQKRLLDQMD